MQGQAGPFGGCPPRSRSAAEMDGCSRQNPAYRLATERAPSGALSICPFAIPLSPAVSIGRSGGRFRHGYGWTGPLLARPGLALRPAPCEHVFAMIVCVLLPRFALSVAAGGPAELARGP